MKTTLLSISLLLLNSPLFCTQGRSLTGPRLGVSLADVQHWVPKDIWNGMVSPLRHGTFNSSTVKNWFFWTLMLEKIFEGPLDSKEIPPVNSKGNQPWIYTGRTNAEVQAPILWPPDAKSWLTGKDPDAGKDGGQEKVMTEVEMVGWHHWLNAHEFEQTPADSEGQGSLVCCSPWSHRVRHNLVTEQQQWQNTSNIFMGIFIHGENIFFTDTMWHFSQVPIWNYMPLITTPNNKMWKHSCFGVFSHLSPMPKLQPREYSYVTAWMSNKHQMTWLVICIRTA